MTIANPLYGRPLGDAFGYRAVIIIGGVPTRAFHGGRDIAAPAGTPVLAGGSGTVVYTQTGWYRSGGNHYVTSINGRPIHDASAGNSIGIQYDDGTVITYSHALNVSKFGPGTRVTATTQIMTVGSTGMSTGPHLHMTAFPNLKAAYAWQRVNPDLYIDYNLRPGGKGSNSNSGSGDTSAPAPIEGFLMELTDTEQRALYNAVVAIRAEQIEEDGIAQKTNAAVLNNYALLGKIWNRLNEVRDGQLAEGRQWTLDQEIVQIVRAIAANPTQAVDVDAIAAAVSKQVAEPHLVLTPETLQALTAAARDGAEDGVKALSFVTVVADQG